MEQRKVYSFSPFKKPLSPQQNPSVKCSKLRGFSKNGCGGVFRTIALFAVYVRFLRFTSRFLHAHVSSENTDAPVFAKTLEVTVLFESLAQTPTPQIAATATSKHRAAG